MIKNIKYLDKPERSIELTLSFCNNSKHNILVYLENMDEDIAASLNLKEVNKRLIFKNFIYFSL